MPSLKPLLLLPLLSGSLAFACGGGDARPSVAVDTPPRRPAAGAVVQKPTCPDPAEVSRVLGAAVKPMRSAIGCQYASDDQSYGADLILGAAATGTQLMREVREEAEGRQQPTEAPGFGDQGVLWAGIGNATGVVIGNRKSAYAAVTMGGKGREVTKAAVLELIKAGIR